MRVRPGYLLAATLPSFALSACGGDGSSTAFIPPPQATPTPTPTPTPSPTPAPGPGGPAVPAAVQTSTPGSPVAGGTKFSTVTQATDFPLLMTAVKWGAGDGDQVTASAGGVLRANPNGTYTLTANNPALGIINLVVPVPSISGGFYGAFDIFATVDAADLSYTRYGSWTTSQVTEGSFYTSSWTAGFVTPSGQIPLHGTATFTGKATGLHNAPIWAGSTLGDFDSKIVGNVALTADFGHSSLTGSITNIVATSLYSSNPVSGPVNDIAFSAAIDSGNNFFNGTTSVTSVPGGLYSFGPTASGLIDGRFYGPNAAEAGAVFNVTEGNLRLIGSFGVKQ